MNRPTYAHPHKVIACREYNILVPFVCHRCGNCCRKYEPVIELELLPEIARCLGEPIDIIQDRLLTHSLFHGAGHPTDCCFLDPLHLRCMIYVVRPNTCRQFPALVGVGTGAVDCPGYREYKSVLNEFTSRLKETPPVSSTGARGRRHVLPAVREDVLYALTHAGASDPYRQIFKEMNDISDSSCSTS